MTVLNAIMNVFGFFVLCAVGCSIGMLFSFLILYVTRKSANYGKWEDLITKAFWKIAFIGVILTICAYAFILK